MQSDLPGMRRGYGLAQGLMLGIALMLAASVATAQQRRRFTLPEGVAVKSVTIWSEGTRLAGDLYYPESLSQGDKLPTIVLSNGWGGTKRGLRRQSSSFAAAGYIALAFDYRGWGESEGRLVIVGKSPEPDEKGEANVRVKVIRNVVDPLGWAQDFRHVLDFVEGEAGVDPERIGIWGTSYGGGMVVWIAAHDSRPKCVVSQVPGMGAMSEAGMELGRKRAREHARGEIEPIPQGIDEVQGLRGTPHRANMSRYNAVRVAHRINVPTLIIDAENEELMDRHKHGEAVYKIIKAKGDVPTKYYVVEGIGHYGIYRESLQKSIELGLEWFDAHLK